MANPMMYQAIIDRVRQGTTTRDDARYLEDVRKALEATVKFWRAKAGAAPCRKDIRGLVGG